MKLTIKHFDGAYPSFNVSVSSKEGAEPFITIRGCRVVEGQNGAFVSFPSRKQDAWNRRAQPDPQAFPPITEQQSQWGRLYTAANALVVQMGYHGSMQADSIEMESLKDKLHDLDGGEWMPGLMPPAQPVAPADAAPSVAPEPLGWAQIGLLNGQHYLRQVYDRTPYPPPADIARNLNLVPVFAHPPRAPLTDAEVEALIEDAGAVWTGDYYRFDGADLFKLVRAAHGISAEGAAK